MKSNKMMYKRILAFVLALVLMGSTFSSASVSAYAVNPGTVELQTEENAEETVVDLQTTEVVEDVTADLQSANTTETVIVDVAADEEIATEGTAMDEETAITDAIIDTENITEQEAEIIMDAPEQSDVSGNNIEQDVEQDIEQNIELFSDEDSYTVNFTYDEKYVDLVPYVDDEQAVLQKGSLSVPIGSGYTYKIKLKNADYMFTGITHSYQDESSENGEAVESIILSDCPVDEESGYYTVIPNIPFDDREYNVVIEVKRAYKLSFEQDESVGIYRMQSTTDGFVEDAGDLSESIRCAEGSMFYFGVEQKCAYGVLSIATDEDGQEIVEPIGESMSLNKVYGVEITKDTTLYVKVIPRSIPIQYNEGLISDIEIINSEGVYPAKLSADKKAIEIYDCASFTLRIKPAAGRILYEAHSVWKEISETETVTRQEDSVVMNEYLLDEEGYYLYDCSIGTENNTGYTEAYKLEEGYTLSFNAPDATVIDTNQNTIDEPKTVIDGGTFYFRVVPAVRYQLLYVTTNGKENGSIEAELLEEQGVEYYSVTMTGDTTVSVVTQELDRQIFFKTEGGVELYLPSESSIYQDNGNYYVGTEAEQVSFGIYPASSGEVPVVSMQTDRGNVVALSGKAGTTDSGDNIYLFTIQKKYFSGEMRVYAADPSVERELRINYPANDFIDEESIKVTVDGEIIQSLNTEDEEAGTVQRVYSIPVGKQAEIELGTYEHCYIDLADISEGNSLYAQNKEISSRTYTDTIKMNLNTNVILTTRGAINHTIYEIMSDGSYRELEPMGSSYQIMKGKNYWIKTAYGNTPVELSEVEISGGVRETYLIEEYLYIDPNNTSAFFVTIPEEVEISLGSINFSLRGTYTKNNDSMTFSRSFRPQVVEDVAALRVRTSATAKQFLDRYFVYNIETKSSKGGWANVGLEVTVKDGAEEHITYDWKLSSMKGILKICADSHVQPGEAAEIRFFRYDREKTDEDYYIPLYDNKNTKIDYISYAPQAPTELTENEPTATVVSTDDVSITLNLLANYKRAPLNGKQYYKVEITPKGENIPESIKEATKAPFYVVRQYPETDEEGNEIKGFTQKERFIVNTAEFGYGQEWKYDVSVTLVQTYDKTPITAANEEESVAYRSLEQTFTDVSTHAPAFAVKLSLKKGKSQIYTTQTDVKLADIKYDKYTVCTGASVEDITECDESEKLIVRVENDQVIASASADTAMGKHTIQITPFAPNSLHCEPVTTTVTVVKGIEELDISVPATEVYKAAGKAASMKAAVVYNDGDKTTKTKKVTWSIVDRAGRELDGENALYGMISVKNGTVSVDKNLYMAEGGDYTFRIKAQAADFEGNTTSALSDVLTVSGDPIAIGNVIIVKENEFGDYGLVAQASKIAPTLTTDMLSGAELVALKEGCEIKAVYTAMELEQGSIPATQLTLKSSAAKSVSLTKDGERIVIDADKPAKNIKLTVTANDGGKKSNYITITTQYAVPEELRLRVRNGAVTLNDVSQNETEINYKGTVNTNLTLTVMQKSEEAWSELQAYTNHSVSISGGKIIASDIEKGEYTVVITKDKATVTLSDKANKKTIKYSITNTAYSSQKAPGITLKKKTPTSIVCGVLANRSLEYEINSKYSTKNKYIRVEMDELSAIKKSSDYAAFANACDMVDKTVALEGNFFKMNFSDKNIPLGNYKLTLTLGTKAGGSFIADAKPVNITVKVVKAKAVKGSYRATTTYNNVVIASDGDITEIALSGNAKNVIDVKYTNIANANNKGYENEFLKYFELTEDNKLRLKEDLTPDQIAALKTTKTDNYGYVTYTVVHGDNGYGVPYSETKTVKITVKFKK